MQLTMLGTGHALATKCYNACFALQDDAMGKAPGRTFLVDAGGGNGILTQLERAGIDWHSIHDLFVTHTHVDHLLGSVWILRVVCYGMECGNYQGEFHFWGNDEVVAAADNLAHMLLRPSESVACPRGLLPPRRHRALQSAPDSPWDRARGMRDGGASQCGEPRALPYGR